MKTWQQGAENYHDQTGKFIPSAQGLTSSHLQVCSHHTVAIRNSIFKCLTGSHMTIFLKIKSNYRVRLNVNIDIADSISFYFKFSKGYYFVLRVKQHIFDKARFFLMNNVNLAIVNWREVDRNSLTPFAIIWKLSRQNIYRKIISFPLAPRLY